jgi:hypothetical protein
MENISTHAPIDMLAPLRPYNKKQLAQLYGVHYSTITDWLNRIPDFISGPGYILNIRQVKQIFEHVGWPEKD